MNVALFSPVLIVIGILDLELCDSVIQPDGRNIPAQADVLGQEPGFSLFWVVRARV